MKKSKNKQSIGEMSQTRRIWLVDPKTKVIGNKKGKGSYNRQRVKYAE